MIHGHGHSSTKQPKAMSNRAFKLMTVIMKAMDSVNPHRIDKRVATFGITDGMTVVDYGVGPARYTPRYSKLVGDKGKVYAVDIQELAIKAVQKKIEKYHLTNVEAKQANGYNSGVPDHVADRVTVLDMFFMVPDSTAFLIEIQRITKKDGLLIIDEGHQSREAAKQKIQASGVWEIIAETKDHLTCRRREGY
jgi:ubiquinone/menaquinone biosynthesis C-methylase UbiE